MSTWIALRNWQRDHRYDLCHGGRQLLLFAEPSADGAIRCQAVVESRRDYAARSHMRITRGELAALLRCPRCGSTITVPTLCSDCSLPFDVVNDQPVLIDFARSIIDHAHLKKSGAMSPVARRTVSRRPAPHMTQVFANLRRVQGLLSPGALILIVGSGSDEHGLAPFYNSELLTVVGLDIYCSPLTDVVADAHAVPLASDSFDCVIVQAVLEHVLFPQHVVDEIWRVLKPGGFVYSETPFLQQVHEGAYDFTRFTESGHRWLYRKFVLIDSGPIGGALLVLAWTVSHLVSSLCSRWPRVGRAVRRLLTAAGRFEGRVPQPYRSDSASATYLIGQKVLAFEELEPSGIVEFYRGAQ